MNMHQKVSLMCLHRHGSNNSGMYANNSSSHLEHWMDNHYNSKFNKDNYSEIHCRVRNKVMTLTAQKEKLF